VNCVEQDLQVVNKLGLHARAAAALVNLAAGFAADIRLGYRGKEVDAKSIMGVMMLAAAQGAEVRVVATGPDAEHAVARIAGLFDGRFGEDE
jgi:phosphocarrier protein